MVKAIALCNVCNADNEYEVDTAVITTITCYNCGNIIPIARIDKDPSATKPDQRMPFIAILFIITCSSPYLIMLSGYLHYANATGDRGWEFLLYILISVLMCLINLIVGLPVLFLVKCNSSSQKMGVAASYVIGGVLPSLFIFNMYIKNRYNNYDPKKIKHYEDVISRVNRMQEELPRGHILPAKDIYEYLDAKKKLDEYKKHAH